MIAGGNVLSTGKSSNSSSSSKAAASFVSFVSALLSVVVALVVCGAAPEAGAADIVRRGSRSYSRKESDARMKTGSLARVTQKQEVAVVGFEGVLESLGALAETNS
jgi:hypothetical protein